MLYFNDFIFMANDCHLQLNLQTTQRRAELKKGFKGYTLYNKPALLRQTLIGTELTEGGDSGMLQLFTQILFYYNLKYLINGIVK